MREHRHPDPVRDRLALVAQRPQSVAQILALSDHEMVDPVLEPRAGLTVHAIGQHGGECVAFQGRGNRRVEECIGVGPALELERPGRGGLGAV